jgi:aldose 1-epimerase
MTMAEATSRVTRDILGVLPDGRAVERVVLRGERGFAATIMTYGATLQALTVPDAAGRLDDVVLGHDDLTGYLAKRQFFGVTVGRYANRIANARFELDGAVVQLAANDGLNALHGGPDGFDRRLWQICEIQDGALPAVTLGHVSPDGDEGYPGRLDARVTYQVTGPAELSLTFAARTDRPTIVNLTNHSYFNLEGATTNADILDHRLTVAADHFLPVDANLIPLPGPPCSVVGTPFDFRAAHTVGARIDQDDGQLRQGKGYDHNFCLQNDGALRLAARLAAPGSGRVLELLTNQPGLQVYSGNRIGGTTPGKGQRLYRPRGAICLEPQIWPDAPNRSDFPSPRLTPDKEYRHHSVYRFSAGGSA